MTYYTPDLISRLYLGSSGAAQAVASYELRWEYPTKYDNDGDPLPKPYAVVDKFTGKVAADWALGQALVNYDGGETFDGANRPSLRTIYTITWARELPPPEIRMMGEVYKPQPKVAEDGKMKGALFTDTMPTALDLDAPARKRYLDAPARKRWWHRGR